MARRLRHSGVAQAVSNGNGTIGYADASQAGDLGTVKVGVVTTSSPTPRRAMLEVSERIEVAATTAAYDLARDTTEEAPPHRPRFVRSGLHQLR